jgi:hypothetical protein
MGKDSPFTNNVVDSLTNPIRVIIQAQMSEEHGARKQHGGRIGLILSLDIEADVSTSGLKHGDIAAHVAAGDDAGPADEGGADVGQDAAVEVGHDHDVELLGAGDGLHGGVVDDHVVGLEGGEVLGDLLEGVAEETVGQLHDVGLVDARHLLAIVGQGEGEGEFGDAFALGAGDDLERLDHAGDGLVLQARVFAFGILADDAEVDVGVACFVAGDVLDEHDGGVDVEFLSEGDVEGLVARAFDWRVEDAFKTEFVSFEGGDGFLEEFFRVLVARVHARDVHLFPFYWYVVGFENGLDGFGDFSTNAVT